MEATPGPARTPWPFVGRDAELRLFERSLDDPGCRGFVIIGPAGVGKTRLAVESLALAERRDMVVVRATSTKSALGIPFGAFGHLIPSLRDSGAPQDRADLLRRSAQAIVALGAGRPLLLFVDDAHLLDDASATLVHQLALTGSAFVLLTVRDPEPAPAALLSLWKEEMVERLDLDGLTEDAMVELVGAVLGGAVDRYALATVIERCNGNVLFLRELILGALNDRSLERDGTGTWRLDHEVQPSKRLVGLVDTRLEGLSQSELDLLELVALGEPLEDTDLAELGMTHLGESLERHGLLQVESVRSRVEVRLAHPIYGDVIRAKLPVLRARSIARTLAELVEARSPKRTEDILRIGRWRLIGGGGDARSMLEAATLGRWQYDFGFAEQLAVKAIELGAGFEARLLLGQLASLQGRSQEAEGLLRQLQEEATLDAGRARVATARMDNFLYADRAPEGLAVEQQLEGTINSVRWRDELLSRRLAILVNLGGPRETFDAAQPLLERASGTALVWACMTASWSAARLGRTDAAIAIARRGRAAQLELETPIEWYPWFHDFNSCEALLHAGRLVEAEALAHEQYANGANEHSPEAQGVFALQLSKVLLARGHVEAGGRYAEEAISVFRRLGRPMFLRESQIVYAHALSLGRRGAEGLAVLADIDVPDAAPAMYDAVSRCQVRGWLAAAEGDIPAAIELLEESASLGEEIGDHAGAIGSLHSIARLGRASTVLERIQHLADQMEGPLPRARADHVAAMESRTAEGLAEVSVTFENIGADLLAADSAADAAAAARRQGRYRWSVALARRADLLATRCKGARTPAMPNIDARAELTPCERETALLAAAGRPNREIAETLVLSVRTVENRLQHVYEKLGVSGRRQLARALGVDSITRVTASSDPR
jgi:DNA-binding CsgD family transcriptional regulator